MSYQIYNRKNGTSWYLLKVRKIALYLFISIFHLIGTSPYNWIYICCTWQSGCCKPPTSCGFTYVNGTTWIPTPAAAGAPAAATNVDCSRWSNNQQTLCFQCDSCKAGFLDDIKKAWSFDALYPILALVGAFLSCFAGVKYWRPRLDTGYSLIRERAVA